MNSTLAAKCPLDCLETLDNPELYSCIKYMMEGHFVGKNLFTQQQTIFDQAVTAIQEGQHYILISGPSGCGKTFLSNRLCTWVTENFYAGTATKSIRFLGDNRCSE